MMVQLRVARSQQRGSGSALLVGSAVYLALGHSASAEDTAPTTEEIVVIGKRLDEMRTGIQPRTGASTYTIDRTAIEEQPGGSNNPLNQVLLQAPGVAQDSFGQLHIRGEHANTQYRINGTIIPEGISGFGQALSPRFADKVELITGALPAQYGLRTAAVIDITTRSGALENGGAISLYGGSHGTIQPSFEIAGSVGSYSYFASGDYLQNGLGIESPDGRSDPLHDRSQQGHGFLYLTDVIDPSSRISVIAGTERAQFQIPNRAGLQPGLGLTVNGQSDLPSELLNQNQREITQYGILAYQHTQQSFDVQVSTFTRYSSLYYQPDPVGDLLYNGTSPSAYRSDLAIGLQGDGAYHFSETNTLRSGFVITGQRERGKTFAQVLPVDATGAQTSDQPVTVTDRSGKTGWEYSVYAQDEWKILPSVTLNLGGRFDLVDEFTHESQFSPRAALVWQPYEGTTIHAAYARTFTPPPFELVSNTSVALYNGTTGASGSTLNNTSRAEKANYFDVGVSQEIMKGLQVGLDGYYKRARNLVDEGQFGAPIILTPFTYASGKQQGVELTTSYRNGGFSSYANVAANLAEGKGISSAQFNFSQDDLNYIASHYIHLDHDQTYTISAGASYLWQNSWGSTRFSSDLLYGTGLRSSTDHPNSGSLPNYVQVNLGVTHGFELPYAGSLQLRFDVVNVLDEKYEIRNGTGVGVGAPQFGPRRGFFGGVTKFF